MEARKGKTTVKIYGRNRWKARAPRPMQVQTDVDEIFIHITVNEDDSVNSLKEQAAAMRGLQDFHMTGRGWSDLGYHYVVFQPNLPLRRARVFRGRLRRYVPSAQAGHNSKTIAIAVYELPNKKIKKATYTALEQLIAELRGIYGNIPVRAHREVVATDCPGEELARFTRRI